MSAYLSSLTLLHVAPY